MFIYLQSKEDRPIIGTMVFSMLFEKKLSSDPEAGVLFADSTESDCLNIIFLHDRVYFSCFSFAERIPNPPSTLCGRHRFKRRFYVA